MRITKRQLRRIIKEEKARILAENRVRRRVRSYLMREMGMLSEKEAHLDEEDLDEIILQGDEKELEEDTLEEINPDSM